MIMPLLPALSHDFSRLEVQGMFRGLFPRKNDCI